MALKDKLERLTQKIKVEGQKKEEKERNEELSPLRTAIKKLEKEKLDLEMIKNSLDFKKENSVDGLGMKEYADLTAKEAEASQKELEEISQGNEAALELIGVETVDDLAARPEFSEDEEVVIYKKAKKQETELNLSDAKLKSRLESLGIKMEDKDFSYEAASDEIGRRLEALEAELIEHKLKTPEGKEEIIDNLSKEFAKETKDIFWTGNYDNENNPSENSYYKVSFREITERGSVGQEGFTVDFLDNGKTKATYGSSLRLTPKNFGNQVEKYGLEIASDALKDSYEKKLEKALTDPEAPLGKAKRLRTAIEAVSPEKRQEAEESLQSFIQKKEELLNLLQLKSEELKASGIDFNPTTAQRYGLSYKEVFAFGRGNVDMENEQELLQKISKQNDLFPGRGAYDFDKLSAAAKKRQSELEEAILVVKNISTKEEADDFLGHVRGASTSVSSFHKQALNNDYEAIMFEAPKEISDQEEKNLPKIAKNFEEAAKYLDKEIVTAEEAKSKVAEKLAAAVELGIVEEFELKNKFGAKSNLTYLGGIEDRIKSVEREKEDASILLAELAGLKNKLTAETEISISGETVRSLEKTREYERLSKELDEKEKEISDKEIELRTEKNTKPGIFGKGKWQTKISTLEEDLEKAKQEKIALKSDYDKNVKEAYNYIATDKLSLFSETEKILKGYKASGKDAEVFKGLEDKLMAVANNEVPDDIKYYYDKLSDLYKKIRGEK